MDSLWAALAIVLAVAGLAIWLYRMGRKVERGATAAKNAEIKDAQLEAGNQRRDAPAVSDKLRRGKF
jgi:hypothetical protein